MLVKMVISVTKEDFFHQLEFGIVILRLVRDGSDLSTLL